MHTFSFRSEGVRVTQETFASHPDRVLVHRLAADRTGALACTVRLASPHRLSATRSLPDGRLLLEGRVQTNGVAFAALAAVRAEGRGAKVAEEDGRIVVRGADAVEIVWTAATNVKAWNALGGDPRAACETVLKGVAQKIGRAHV